MTSSMLFISIPELKAKLGVTTLDIVKNPNGGKIFAASGSLRIKVKQAIDASLPIKFMYAPDKFEEGCIVNVTPANAPLFSL